jgi:hypothetical protein
MNQEHQQNAASIDDRTPPDCFRLDELERMQAAEQQRLTDVNYYLWLNQSEGNESPYRFLYFLELIFERGEALLFTSGEDTDALRLSDPEALLEIARNLQEQFGHITIKKVNARNLPIWQTVMDNTLEAIRLSKNDQGLYLNDAILLDFGDQRLLLGLSEHEGLAIGNYT